MSSAMIERCNSMAKTWAWWMGLSLLDAAVVLAVVSLLWLAIRRKASPQLGFLLFLLVPLKLFIPVEIAVPERIAAWMPSVVVTMIGRPDVTAVPPVEISPLETPVASAMPAEPVVGPMTASRALPDDRPTASENLGTAIPIPKVDPGPKLSLPAWLMLGWLAGVLVLFLRLVHSQVRFHRIILRKAGPIDPGRFSVDFSELLWRVRLGRTIRIVESPLISSPVVGGIFRPMLILPAGIATSLSAGQLEWVLLHELAHVRRRDLIVKAFQSLATILHFVNPAIWIANRMIDRFREFACDDVASAFGNSSRTESGEAFLGVMRFAASIQRGKEARLDGAIGVFESTARSSCFERMRRLLDANRQATVRLGLGSICILLLTAVLALPQIRAANPPAVEEKVAEQSAETTIEKKEEPKTNNAAAAEKKREAKKNEEAVFQFSVVIARHVMLLEGKEIVTWKQIEEIIAKRPNPSQTLPSFYFTNGGAHEAGVYKAARKEIRRLDITYKFVNLIMGFIQPRASLQYDRIKTPADLKLDESLRINGLVIGKNGKPVADAEVILVTPIDDSISNESHTIYLEQGRARDPLEEVIGRTDQQGRFVMYPPKRQNYSLIAMHPNGGFGVSERDQLVQNENKIFLLEWAGLVSEFGKETDKKAPSWISTCLPPSGDVPEIVLTQMWSGLKVQQPTLRHGFTHVPPIYQTTVFYNDSDEGLELAGTTTGLLESETRRLDLGPLTEQQRKWLEQMLKECEQPGYYYELEPKDAELKPAAKDDISPKAAPSKKTDDPSTENDKKIPAKSRRFELTVLGPDKKPVPRASVRVCNAFAKLQRGTAIKDKGYNQSYQTDANGSLVFDFSNIAIDLMVMIEQPGYAPYCAEWSGDHPETIPSRFVAELDAGWSIGGVVVDEQGRPIEGVKVRPSIEFKQRPRSPKRLHVGERDATDAEGKWRYSCVPASLEEVHAEISHPSYKPTIQRMSRSEFSIPLNGQPTAKIVLKRGVTVVGCVTDESGKPIAGAMIHTKFHNDSRDAETNEKGEYRLEGCDAVKAQIEVTAKGRAIDFKEVEVAPGMEPVNFEMKPGGKVRARVVDKDGKPMKAFFIVRKYNGGGDPNYRKPINTDENGVWVWDQAPSGEFIVDVCPQGGLQRYDQRMVAREEEYVFKMFPQLVVTGRVFDTETKEPIKSFRVIPGYRMSDNPNDPAAKTHIGWASPNTYLARNNYQAKDGQYRVPFDCEFPAHLIRIEADGYRVAVSRDITSDEGNVQVDFAMVKAEDVAVAVLTPEGQPAAGAEYELGIAGSDISVVNGKIHSNSIAHKTDAAGRFRFPLPDGPFLVVIVHPSGFAFLKSDQQKISGTIRLSAWARIEGTSHVGSKPAAGARIWIHTGAFEALSGDEIKFNTNTYGTADNQGRFVIEQAIPGEGTASLRLKKEDGKVEDMSSAHISVYLSPGTTNRFQLNK